MLYKVVTCNRWKDSALGRLHAGTGMSCVAARQVTEVTPPWLHSYLVSSIIKEERKRVRPELSIPPALFSTRERRMLVGL